jgi:heterodisulfide reductase subunit B
VLKALGVEVTDIREFNCCGYPLKNADMDTSVLFATRNLALAEKQGLNVMTLCKCCFGNLKKVNHTLREDGCLRDRVNAVLATEGLAFTGGVEVTHFLKVLHEEVGLAEVKKSVTRSYNDLKIATHYGCHALRPSDIMAFDHPVAPVIFDELVRATGARSVDWPLKLECCGAPVLGSNDELSMDLTGRKLTDAKEAGAHYLCVGCPWCQAQFDTVQEMLGSQRGGNHHLPSILYPQLLGLAMGIEAKALGLRMNKLDISGLEQHLS